MQPSINYYLRFCTDELDAPKSEVIKSQLIDGQSHPSYLPISHNGSTNDYFLRTVGHELGGPVSILWISNLCIHRGEFYAQGLVPTSEATSGQRNSTDQNRLPGDVIEIRQPSFLITPHQAAHNYFHFMVDSLPRFHLRERYAFFSKPVLVSRWLETFQSQMMKTLIHKNYPIVDFSHSMIIRECAVMWPLSRAAAVKFLRNRASTIKQDRHAKRLYITRRNASFRRILNEFDLEPILEKFGFQIIECESISIQKQISLFKSAEIVCGPHGAGLANIAFCPSGASILEIIMEERISTDVGPVFWELACAGNLDYHILTAARIPTDESYLSDGAMQVDPRKFEAALSYILEHRKTR